MRNQSRITGALVAPDIPGYRAEQDKRLPFDPAAAKSLLVAAGVPEDTTLNLVCTPEGYIEEQICQGAVAMWARIGLKVNLQLFPHAIATQRRVARQFDVTPLGWANEPAIDALSLLTQVVHINIGAKGIFNWGEWDGASLDETIDATANELDTDKRLPLESSMRERAGEDIMFLPLHQQPMAWAMQRTITRMVQLLDNKVRLWMSRMEAP